MIRIALALAFVLGACDKAPAKDVQAEREMNDDLYRLEHQAKEIGVALEMLDKQLEAAVTALESAKSEEERARLRVALDKLVAEKATLDKRVEALDAAVKARAGSSN